MSGRVGVRQPIRGIVLLAILDRPGYLTRRRQTQIKSSEIMYRGFLVGF